MHDWNSRVRSLAAQARFATGAERDWATMHDPGTVPPQVMPRLAALACRHGYSLSLVPHITADSPDQIVLGRTIGKLAVPADTIELLDGMSPASTARVMGHELGHVLLQHPASSQRDLLYKSLLCTIYPMLHPQLETACELGTTAFCQAAGIGTGQSLKRYLGQCLHGTGVWADTLKDAAFVASSLWEAVTTS